MNERQYTSQFLSYVRTINKMDKLNMFIDHVQDVPVAQSTKSYDFLLSFNGKTVFCEAKKITGTKFNINTLTKKQFQALKTFQLMPKQSTSLHFIIGYHVNKEAFFDALWLIPTYSYDTINQDNNEDIIQKFTSKEYKNFRGTVKECLRFMFGI